MAQSILGIIPARFASTRFPGKPLIHILGKSMIQRVYEQAKKSTLLNEVVVATDDERIYNHVVEFGGKAVYTKTEHPSGTDRCYEALQNTPGNFDYVINIQGDEPFIDPTQIDLLANVCDGKTELATLMIPVDSHEVLFDMGEDEIPTLPRQEINAPKEINEIVNTENSSRNDNLKTPVIELSNKLAEGPIKDLKKAIGINDRFLYINELFRGDEVMYERSIKTINSFSIWPEAEYWIRRELKTKLGWIDSDATVIQFDQLIKKRFS